MAKLTAGAVVLSDRDPAIGKIEHIRVGDPANVAVLLFPNKNSVRRNARCLFALGNRGEYSDEHTLDVETLRCKAYRVPVYPNPYDPRRGSLIIQKWFKKKMVSGGGIHFIEANIVLYAIIFDGALVFRSYDDVQMRTFYPDTNGEPDVTSLCRLHDYGV